jgi:hypothetical protein
MERLQRLEDNAGHIKIKVDKICDTVGAIDESLRGNSKPGLGERVRLLERASRFVRAIIAALAAAGLTLSGLWARDRWFK